MSGIGRKAINFTFRRLANSAKRAYFDPKIPTFGVQVSPDLVFRAFFYTTLFFHEILTH